MSTPPAPRQVRCPACGGAALYAPQNRWRPFCSARCRGVDLGAWASEQFRIPVSDAPLDEDGIPPRTDEPPPRGRH